MLDNKVCASGLWNMAITKYGVLAFMPPIVVTGEAAVGYQFAEYFFLSSCSVLSSLLVALETVIHNYGFCLLINPSEFN